MSIPEETVEVDCLHECEEKEVVDEDEEGCEADINQKRDIAGKGRRIQEFMLDLVKLNF